MTTESTGAAEQTEVTDAGTGAGDGTIETTAAHTESGNGEQGGAQTQEQQTAEPVYEYTLPEGLSLDDALADRYTALCKEQGIKPETAQALLAFQAEQTLAQQAAYEAERESMRQQTRALPNADALIAQGKQALARFNNPELSNLFTDSILGDHPAVVQFLAWVGEKTGEAPVRGEGGSARASREARMYPSMK